MPPGAQLKAQSPHRSLGTTSPGLDVSLLSPGGFIPIGKQYKLRVLPCACVQWDPKCSGCDGAAGVTQCLAEDGRAP